MSKLFDKIKELFKPSKTIGVSFDSKIKLKEVPIALPIDPISFYKLNKDLSNFEVMKVNKKYKEITLVELASNTEIVVNFKTFDLLFSNAEVPAEVKF
jgi:hypothetical protein